MINIVRNQMILFCERNLPSMKLTDVFELLVYAKKISIFGLVRKDDRREIQMGLNPMIEFQDVVKIYGQGGSTSICGQPCFVSD